ncbi:MAG TPA: glycosyltransferase family 1 protein [Desulfobacterales bacterium]|nr:glycosyltransferase family 1 protein [Desulfobacterales bacterium]
MRSEKVNVLYVNGTGDASGAENSTLTLLRRLDRARFCPILVCPFIGTFTELAKQSGVEISILDVKALAFTRGPIIFSLDMVRLLPFILRLTRLIKKESIDLLHVNSYRIGVPCSIAAKLAGVPVIWHVRDIPASKIKRRAVAWLADKLADKVIAVSGAVANVFKGEGKGTERVEIIYNGIDADEFAEKGLGKRNELRQEFGVDESSFLIGNIGQLIPWKGQDRFIKAARRTIDHVPRAKFLIVGGEVRTAWRTPRDYVECKSRLLDLVRELGMSNHVVFTGLRRDIPAILSALDLYVHSSISPDPLPRVLLEAMACRVPIVAPQAGGIPEMIEDGTAGILFPPGDVGAMCNAIVSLLMDEDKRHEMADVAYAIVKTRFSVESHVRRITEVYEELLLRAQV